MPHRIRKYRSVSDAMIWLCPGVMVAVSVGISVDLGQAKIDANKEVDGPHRQC